MITTLTRHGERVALILDQPLMDRLQIRADTPLRLTVEGRRLIVEAAPNGHADETIEETVERTLHENAELFRRLAR